MRDTRGVIGMAEFAAKRSSNKFVAGREDWKSSVVNKPMYGADASVCYESKCENRLQR